jgi:uncharacterized membrane protein
MDNSQTQMNIGAMVALIVGVSIAVLTLIFVGVLGGQVYQNTEADIEGLVVTVANDTFVALNTSNVSLANNDIVPGTLTVTNVTGDNLLLANFTIDYVDGQVFLLTDNLNGTTMHAAYQHGDYVARDYIKNSIISGFRALNTTGSYMPIVVLAIIIFVVLSIVMGLGAIGGVSKSYSGAL